MPANRDHAIVLRCWEFSETSQTVALLCRGLGMLRGLAKGSRRATPSARFGGGFEPLTRGEVGSNLKPGSELASLVEWDLQEIYWGPRRSLDAHYAGMYVADLLFHLVLDHDPHPVLFDATDRCLRALHDQPSVIASLLSFQWTLLIETGFRPTLTAATATIGAPVEWFDPGLGGVVDGQDNPGTRPWRVRAQTLDVLRTLAAGGEPPASNRPSIGRAVRLLGAYLEFVAGREIPSARWVLAETDHGVQGVPNASQT